MSTVSDITSRYGAQIEWDNVFALVHRKNVQPWAGNTAVPLCPYQGFHTVGHLNEVSSIDFFPRCLTGVPGGSVVVKTVGSGQVIVNPDAVVNYIASVYDALRLTWLVPEFHRTLVQFRYTLRVLLSPSVYT